MQKITTFAFAAILICGGSNTLSAKSPSHRMHSVKHEMAHKAETQATKAYQRAHMKMMQAAPAYTGDADADFRLQMIPHHQGAIDMANVALNYAKDESTKEMARQIITAQEKEIADMRAWLKQRGKPAY
jgi:uncharacterized protein (DUF305 family)